MSFSFSARHELQSPHRIGSPEALGLFRIVVFGIWFLHFWQANPMIDGGLDRGLFKPVGIFALFPSAGWDLLLNVTGQSMLRGIGLILTGLAMLGVRPFPLVGIPAVASILLFDAIGKSYGGFLNHAQFASLYSVFVLLLFPSADGYSVMGRNKRLASNLLYATPLLVVALTLSVAYQFVGMARVTIGGFEIFTGEALRTYVIIRSLEGAEYSYQYGIMITNDPYLYAGMMVGFAVVTICEVLAPLAVFHTRFRLFWLAVMIPFHVMSLFTMNIFFWENLLIILALFTPMARWVAEWRRPTSTLPATMEAAGSEW